MKFSGETWVGNLYQKLEAVCHEVDGLVSQEHIKNLENHVQFVGDNVMKLCSNVKDLLPSSDVIDSLSSYENHDQVTDEDLLETHASELPFSQSDSSVISEDCGFLPLEERQTSEVSEQVRPESDPNSDLPSCGSELTHSESSLISSNSGLVTKEEEESLSNFRESIFPDNHLCERATTISIDFSASDHKLTTMSELQLVGGDILKCSSASELHLKEEVLCDSIHQTPSNFTTSSRSSKVEDFDYGSLHSISLSASTGFPKETKFSIDLEFEGSYVFVEGSSCAPERAESRKKKARGWFSSRKKLEKEYKQLAIWHCDIDSEFDPPNHNKHLSSQDVHESE